MLRERVRCLPFVFEIVSPKSVCRALKSPRMTACLNVEV